MSNIVVSLVTLESHKKKKLSLKVTFGKLCNNTIMDREAIIRDFIDLLSAQDNNEARKEILHEVQEFICFDCGKAIPPKSICHCYLDKFNK